MTWLAQVIVMVVLIIIIMSSCLILIIINIIMFFIIIVSNCLIFILIYFIYLLLNLIVALNCNMVNIILIVILPNDLASSSLLFTSLLVSTIPFFSSPLSFSICSTPLYSLIPFLIFSLIMLSLLLFEPSIVTSLNSN